MGKTIGAYQLTSKIGQGAMGAVYVAKHTKLGREAAVKLLPKKLCAEHPQFAQRFFIEARTAAAINHPNIVQIHDAGEQDGIHFIAMEFVHGVTLKDFMKSKDSVSQKEALRILQQACRGLAEALKSSVIHRDIKPANLMINDKGLVKIADFGLAKDLESDVSVTVSGQILGTPAYMSPEQGEGRKVDFRTDIYSLGTTIFQVLTGEKPYSADTPVAILMKHVMSPVPDPREIRPDIHPAVAAMVMKMMGKKPEQRQASYDELLEEIGSAMAALDGKVKPASKAKAAPAKAKPPSKAKPKAKKKEKKKKSPGRLRQDTPANLKTASPGRKPAKRSRKAPAQQDPAKAKSALPLIVGGVVGGLLILVLIFFVATRGSGDSDQPKPDGGETTSAPDKKHDKPDGAPDQPGENTPWERAVEAVGDTRRTAEEKDDPDSWSAVVDAVKKALALRDDPEMASLAVLARARLDLSQARRAESEGDLRKALNLATRAKESGAQIPEVRAFIDRLSMKIDETRALKAHREKIETLVKQAQQEEAKGTAEALDKAVSLWADALAATRDQEERQLFQDRIDGLSRRIDYLQAMKRGEKAEQASDKEAAVRAYREALRFKPDDEKARAAIARLDRGEGPKKPDTPSVPKTPTERRARFRKLVLEAAKKGREKGENASLEAIAMLREALTYADDQQDRRLTQRSLNKLIIEFMQKAMARAREAENQGDWITAIWAYERALTAMPGEAYPERQLANAQAELAKLRKRLGGHFVIPGRKATADSRGNPVATRDGSRIDRKSGLPFEIWLARPCMEFVLVPSGSGDIGSPLSEMGRRREEGPKTEIRLAKAFYMAKYECTQSQWREIMRENPATFSDRPDHPVETVSWAEVMVFIDRVNALSEDRSAPGLRLPSESEWEYAARAGSNAPYPGGRSESDLSAYAWYSDNATNTTHPVGALAPNGFDLYDMIGNVAEWCADLFHPSHDGLPADGSPRSSADSEQRVVRGGAFNEGSRDCRHARRRSADPDKADSSTGFRLAFTPR